MESWEIVGTLILAIAAVAPLAWHGVRQHRLVIRVFSIVLLSSVVGGVYVIANSTQRMVAPLRAQHRPIKAPDDGYVASEACRSCHPRHHASWEASYHSKMTQLASPESIVGDFDDVELQRGEMTYRLSREGDRFLVRVASQGKVWSDPWEVVMTTGSHHRQWVWVESGDSRKLTPLPFIYLVKQQRWIPKEAGFLIPPDRQLGMPHGEWNRNCIQCHTTQGRRREQRMGGGTAMDTRVADFGIACESCHGPGHEHVCANQNPLRRHHYRTRSEEHDPTIVNPANLTAELSAHVCGQCHTAMSLFKSRDRATYEQWNQKGFAYRPGQDLRDSRFLFPYPPHVEAPEIDDFLAKNPNYWEDRFWPDRIVRIAGREFSGLLKTPCFSHDDPSQQMSCLSCHTLHLPEDDPRQVSQWADDQLKLGMDGNRACTQCHQEYTSAENITAHTHHAAESSGSVCYNCHMPHTTFGLLKAIRSHGLTSPRVVTASESTRPNACNQCHLDRTMQWAADRLNAWYGQPIPANLDEDERNVATGVLWALKGDAGQRALVAWHMGWEPARTASGADWMTPFLAELLRDPYAAVRFVARESLQQSAVPVPAEFAEYDFLGPEPTRQKIADAVDQAWEPNAEDARPELLLDAAGRVQLEQFQRLLDQRDQRPISLME